MTDITITRADAVRALEHVVNEMGGDFVYESPVAATGTCYYVYNGACSCGVSRALAYLGVPVEVLSLLDVATHDGLNFVPASIRSDQADGVLERNGVELRYDAATVLQVFQELQDKQVEYGEALSSIATSV